MIKDLNNMGKVFIGPGEFYISSEPVKIITALGSCVAIIMFSEKKKISAIAHCVLPVCTLSLNNKKEHSNYKYIDTAIQSMINKLHEAEVKKEEIKVKIFGGAEQYGERGGNLSVGRLNVDKAFNLLKTEGLQVVSSDVGGNEGRKIILFAHTGDVYISRLGKLVNDKNR